MTTPATPTASDRWHYLLDPTGRDVHAEATALRAAGPAVRAILPGGIPAWTVTDPHLIRRLLSHPKISKDAYQHWPAYYKNEIPADWPLRVWVDVRNALTAYDQEHRRLRRPLAAAFSTRRVRALAPQITAITRTLLDELSIIGPDDEVDLRARFAWRLPLQSVNLILGVPEEFHDESRDVVAPLFITTTSPEEGDAVMERLYALIAKLIRYKRLHRADDITSQLIAACDAGEISDQELEDTFVLLIGAGHETTVNAIDHGLVNLITHPKQLQLALQGTVSWTQVVEECLRHQAPVATVILRFAAEDVHDEPTGLTFRCGDAIAINYAAAGRDPGVHGESADRFDITRPNARDHLAFGHGAHHCVGAEIARIEIRAALEQLFTRFPGVRLTVDPDQLEPLPSIITNGHTRLPVVLGPAA
ncbi:cytochrome P450 [Streptomyces sp. SAI-208]|uniref:cytochrome P450 family protein n=1 Tax=Streptomyces sp. SAI-208 TaxID=2940550 RepID=UPI002476FBB5|nr:cytochrome P450 [Streptomyces sp. SAI-208]MDH6604527.1 cytochrome P450 [Streptomyces sp. SAI-208]